MTKEEIFQSWAPLGATWSPWMKPAVFSRMDWLRVGEGVHASAPEDVGWAGRPDVGTGLVVDLPGVRGVGMGLSLARAGFRPVPLYNGLPVPESARGIVEVRPIMVALAGAAFAMSEIRLPDNAPPAFLLDADRRGSGLLAAPGMFDNRSISLPGDFPSATFLRSRGVRRMVLVLQAGSPLSADLSHTLRGWGEGGIELLWKGIGGREPSGELPRTLVIKSAPKIQLWWYHVVATIGLRRNPGGGFGGIVPTPSGG